MWTSFALLKVGDCEISCETGRCEARCKLTATPAKYLPLHPPLSPFPVLLCDVTCRSMSLLGRDALTNAQACARLCGLELVRASAAPPLPAGHDVYAVAPPHAAQQCGQARAGGVGWGEGDLHLGRFGWLVVGMVGWLVARMAAWLDGWLAGWLVAWMAGWLVGRIASRTRVCCSELCRVPPLVRPCAAAR